MQFINMFILRMHKKNLTWSRMVKGDVLVDSQWMNGSEQMKEDERILAMKKERANKRHSRLKETVIEVSWEIVVRLLTEKGVLQGNLESDLIKCPYCGFRYSYTQTPYLIQSYPFEIILHSKPILYCSSMTNQLRLSGCFKIVKYTLMKYHSYFFMYSVDER